MLNHKYPLLDKIGKGLPGPVVLGHPLPEVKGCINKICYCTGECRKTDFEIQQEKDFIKEYKEKDFKQPNLFNDEQ
jgi:hypothetical protein